MTISTRDNGGPNKTSNVHRICPRLPTPIESETRVGGVELGGFSVK